MTVTGVRPSVLERAPSGALVVCSIASVQFGSAIADTLFSRVGAGGAVLLRLASASIVLGALFRPRVSRMTRREIGLAALFGAVLAGMNISFYHAIARIPLGIAVTFEFVGPLSVAIAGSRRRSDLVWVALAAAGILALTHGDAHTLSLLGVMLALLAGTFWGAYILVSARVGRAFAGGDGLAVAMVTATVVALPFGGVEGGTALLSPHVLLVGCAVGLLSSVIPYTFELEALRRLSTAVFGVLMSLEPAFAALAGLLVLGQGLGARALAGIGLVVAASVGATRRAEEPPRDV